jgi:hypothetical protein
MRVPTLLRPLAARFLATILLLVLHTLALVYSMAPIKLPLLT